MDSGQRKNQKNIFCAYLLIALAFFASVASADSPPSVDSVYAEPEYAGLGDMINVTASASDDLGVKGIYFYSPDSSTFFFQDCGGAASCEASADVEAQKTGESSYCVKAIDASNQLSELSCSNVEVSVDRPPVIKYFQAEQKEKEKPTVHVGGTVKFGIVAEDDAGISKILLEDRYAGYTEENECGGSKTCMFEFKRFFEKEGVYTFCASALDASGRTSSKKCIDVYVVVKNTCEAITVDDSESERSVGLKITTKRLYLDRDGLIGYSAECCEESGFCDSLRIDTRTCEIDSGSVAKGSYNVYRWDPNQKTLGDLLGDYDYPQVLCTTLIGNYTYVGVIDNLEYRIVGETQNLEEELMNYWLMGESLAEQNRSLSLRTEDVSLAQSDIAGRYFFAEQLQLEENETKLTTIIDAVNYSDAVNRLMANECMTKNLESGECHFDCPDYDPKCKAPCGGNCLGCPGMSPEVCWCCKQCHTLLDYTECAYDKYAEMYGRPYVDFLFCWKVPELKDLPWCRQKSDQPTSAVSYPWYGFTRNETGEYRSLESVSSEYIDEVNKWNENVEVNEKPDSAKISTHLWTPEVYCDHGFEDKLFREIWAKEFTITPYLNDLRNNMTWTRTGPGKMYAGGGFRREPSCWWECCRRCAPYCDCMCTACDGTPCCIQAHYSSGVTSVIELLATYTTVSEGVIRISYENGGKVAIVDNGAMKVISTGNIPFTVSASFSKNEASGTYKMVVYYNPSSTTEQFVMAQDIVLSYDLREDAEDFTTGITETFSTSLIVYQCVCTPKGGCGPLVPAGDTPAPSDPGPGNYVFEADEELSSGPTTAYKISYVGQTEGDDTGGDSGDSGSEESGEEPCIPKCPPGCTDGGGCCCCPSMAVPISKTVSISDGVTKKISLDMTKIEALKEAAHNFVDIATNRGIKVGLIAFSGYYGPAIVWRYPLSTDAGALDNHIERYYPTAATCISCGIDEGREMLKGDNSGSKYIIVMSDGTPNVGRNPADAAADAKNEGITVHSIALGNDANRPVMKDIAEKGGGEFFDVICACPLDCIYKTLAESVNGSTVLVSDVSGSMSGDLDLHCAGGSIPIIHKFGALNITVNGTIDNYLDTELSTGVRSTGIITVSANPDVVNKFTFNVDESSIDYYSLVYPVKHMAYRKEYAHGYWAPGIPYTVGEERNYGSMPGYLEYTIDDAYGYETAHFSYPTQCEQICPADCTCPDYDIMDVTCTDADGSKYKRTDCVCLPPKGQSFSTPCSSMRTFHEEEGYYFDFVEFETREVSEDINVTGKLGTNPEYTGNLKGEVFHDLGLKNFNTTFLFIPNTGENTVSKVSTEDCKEVCRYPVNGMPVASAVDLSGNAWIASRTTNEILCLNGSGYECKTDQGGIMSYLVGLEPSAVAIDDENNVWVANFGDGKVWKFNATSRDCILGDSNRNANCPSGKPAVRLSKNLSAIAYDCRGYVWALSSGENRIYKIEKSGRVVANYSVGDAESTYYMAVDGGGDVWVSGKETGWIYKVNGETGELICENKVGEETTGIAVDDENNVWVTDSGKNNVIKIDPVSCYVLQRADAGNGPLGASSDFDGRIWVVNSLSDDVTAFLTNGSEVCSVSVGSLPQGLGDFAGYQAYRKCSDAKHTEAVSKKSSGEYVLDFEALNFPYSIIEYTGNAWYPLEGNETCYDFCRTQGLYASKECSCPDGNSTGCFKSASLCSKDCKGDPLRYGDSGSCCCATPSFKTEDANMTFLIHFRDNLSAQTFALFPPRTEAKSYATLWINVSLRNPTKTVCGIRSEMVKPGEQVFVDLLLSDALSDAPLAGETVRFDVEGYGLSMKMDTDAEGKATYSFIATDQNTKIGCVYEGGEKHTGSQSYHPIYVNVAGIGRMWWFLSPEVLLLLAVGVLAAFSYKWFSGKGFDLKGVLEDLKGKK